MAMRLYDLSRDDLFLRKARDLGASEEAIAIVTETYAQKRRVIQSPVEYVQWIQMLLDLKPKRFLELGIAYAGTLYGHIQTLAEGGTYVAIELNKDFETLYHHGEAYSWLTPEQTLNILYRDSGECVDEVMRLTGGELLDAIFVDAGHEYEEVSTEFTLYSPLLRPGGLMGFHDILNRTDRTLGSQYLWREVERAFPGHTTYFLEHHNDPWKHKIKLAGHGIGVFIKP